MAEAELEAYSYPTAVTEENDNESSSDSSKFTEMVSGIQTGIKQAAKLFDMTPYSGYKEKKTSPQEDDNNQTAGELTPVYVTFDYLKSLITDLNNKTKIRPVLIAFSGLPNCGKTKAVKHLLKHYVDANSLPTMTPKTFPLDHSMAAGISYFELVACGFQRQRNLSITEVSKESSCAFSIISAFSSLIGQRRIPLFSMGGALPTFDNPQLNNNLQHIYDYLQKRYTPKAPTIETDEMAYVKQLTESLPEGIALINIWDLAINKTILHFLTALIGHLYSSHMWLFLDIERDLKDLERLPHLTPSHETTDNQPQATSSSPQRTQTAPVEGQDLKKWRPPLHYLLRTSRISQGTKDDKESRDYKVNPPCTIFARYSSHSHEGIFDKMKELRKKVKRGAKNMKVSSLIDPKIETINLNGVGITDDYSLRLYQKFQQVITETPYEAVPIAWVFLRSLFYYDTFSPSTSVIMKSKLTELAAKCGIDKTSLQDFSKFYTSFGSIFDLTLIDPKYEYVIVKPIGFLRTLDKILNPSDDLIKRHKDLLKYGIVSEEIYKELFQDGWEAYMEALVTVHLAARITSSCINLPGLDRSKVYYFVPLARKGGQVADADINALHILTSIDKNHLFKQAYLVSHLLKLFPNAKLQCCTQSNQTILQDKTLDVTITIVHHSPTTKIHISKPHPEVCSLIVEACHNILITCKDNGRITECNFIIPCATAQLVHATAIPSSHYHILPIDITKCSQCNGRENCEMFKVWNEAIKQFYEKQTQPTLIHVPNNKLLVKDLAKAAQEIVKFLQSNDTSVRDCFFEIFEVLKEEREEQFNDDLESNILHILMMWKKRQCLELETKRCLARKLKEFGHRFDHTFEMTRTLDPYNSSIST